MPYSNYQKHLIEDQMNNNLLSLCKEQGVKIESFERSTYFENVFKKHPESKTIQPYIFNKDKSIAMTVLYNATDEMWQFSNTFRSLFPIAKSFNPFKGEFTKGDSINEYHGNQVWYKGDPDAEEKKMFSNQMFDKLKEYSSWNGHGLCNLDEAIDFIKWYTSQSL